MINLPTKCRVDYYPEFLTEAERSALYADILANYGITDCKLRMADGTRIDIEHGVVVFTDEELVPEGRIPALTSPKFPWPPLMAAIKERIEAGTGKHFRVCPAVYYRDGNSGMEFHSDPSAYGDTNWIASISLGAEREFVLRSVDDHNEQHSIVLGNGSLLLMGENCQNLYEHAVPKDPSCSQPRINLTFRQFGFEAE